MNTLPPIIFTRHALTVIAERNIDPGWVERTIREPRVTMQDPSDSTLVRVFRPIPERQDRMLRVVYRRDRENFLVITAFFDRGYRE